MQDSDFTQLVSSCLNQGKKPEDYHEWLRKNPSCLTGDFDMYEAGSGVSDAAHQRSVSKGAGVAIKPDWWEVPLTRHQHRMTHQHGQSYYNPSAVWDKMAAYYLRRFAENKPPLKEKKQDKEYKIVIYSPNHLNALIERLERWFRRSPDKLLEIIIRPFRKKRSNKQNRYYWGVVVEEIHKIFLMYKNTHIDKDALHEWLKLEFYPRDFITEISVKNKRSVYICKSSTKLQTHEFELWMDNIRSWYNEVTSGGNIPLPNEMPQEYDYTK